MAVTTANVYRATVYLSAGLAAGVQPIAIPTPGQEVLIIAQSPALAVSILQQYFTSPALVSYNGPVLVGSGALTTGTGTFAADDTGKSSTKPVSSEDDEKQDKPSHTVLTGKKH